MSFKNPPLAIHSLSAIQHILSFKKERILSLVVSGSKINPRVQNIIEQAKDLKIEVQFDKKRNFENDSLVLYLMPFQFRTFDSWISSVETVKRTIVLALDHIQDPQNFGALCRTADALQISGVILPKDRSVSIGQGVYHASVGAVETIDIISVTNLVDTLKKLKESGFWIIGTHLSDRCTPPWKVPDFEKAVLVLGQEQSGLSHRVEQTCDWLVKIPISGRVQSLNVSSAGAILMYELKKRMEILNT